MVNVAGIAVGMHESFPSRLAFTNLETTCPWPPEGEKIEMRFFIFRLERWEKAIREW